MEYTLAKSKGNVWSDMEEMVWIWKLVHFIITIENVFAL